MALAGRLRWLWLVLAVLAADRGIKYAIERYTPEGFRLVLIPHFANLVHSQNPGIAFGMFSQTSKLASVLLIASASAVVIFLIWLLLSGHAGGLLSQLGVALIAGGAAGNLLDRLLHGGVTDFLELYIGRFFVWPAFNLADAVITVGACLIAWELLRDERLASRHAHP